LTTEVKQPHLDWRRAKVLELASQGYSEREMGEILKVSDTAVHRDLVIIRRRAQDNLQHHIHEVVPEEYQKCMTGMKRNLRRVLEIADSTADPRLKLQASSIANECYRDIMDLCTNAGIVSDALNFIERKTEKLVSASVASANSAQTTRETDTETEAETATDTDIETEGVF
jgi:predicted transcriptional regulator